MEKSKCVICEKNKSKLIKSGKDFDIQKAGLGINAKKKNDKPKNLAPYCGIKKVPKSRRLGNMKDCSNTHQIRYWGINKVDKLVLSKPKKKPIKQDKLSDKNGQSSRKIKAPKKDMSSKTDNIKIQKLKTNTNVIKMFNDIWYIHPIYTNWGANKQGQILYISYQNLK